MWSRVPAPARWAIGGLAGASSWVAVQPLLGFAPSAARFFIGWLLFTGGPGLAATAWLTRGDSGLRRAVIALAIGSAASAAAIDVLGRLGALALFPFVALALGGAAIAASIRPSKPPEPSDPPEPSEPRRPDLLAAAVLVAIALGTGAIAYSHRVSDDHRGLRVYGDYDSLDLAYYGSITGEAAHTVPPTAPYYAGRGLNYAYYPQLVPAMIHRALDVAVVDMYFGYLWPVLLALAGLTGYVFVRQLAPPIASAVAVGWLMVGGDLSYLAAWGLPHDNVDWDYVLWPTNFLSPTMEVLHFNSWTPSLPLFFSVLIAAAESVRRRSLAWAVTGGVVLAVLFQFKPFAFLVLAGAMAVALVLSGGRRYVRAPYIITLGVAGVCAMPFVARAISLYADRRSELRLDFFLLPQRMLIKLDLVEAFNRAASSIAPADWLVRPLVIAGATLLFLIVGPALRWIGVPAVVRALRAGRAEDAASEPWRVLAWVVIVGVVTPFAIVTEPYHDTLQFYQAGLYALWIFAGTSLVAWASPRGMRGLVVAMAIIALTLPSSAHYLARKWQDDTRPPLVALDPPTQAAVEYLRRQDPRTTVILHDRPLDPSLVTVVSGRRVVLAWARYAVGSDDRRRDVEEFYESAEGDPAAAFDILHRYAVTHVIVRASRARVHPAVLERLQPLLRLEDLTLYAVPVPLPSALSPLPFQGGTIDVPR